MTAKTIPQRNEIAEKDTWNMASIFKTDEEWENIFNEILKSLPEISSFEGRLGESPQVLFGMVKSKRRFY